ncbi:hypothetical protein [Agrobacterium sp. 22-222-1]
MTKERFCANSISPEPGNSAGFFIAEIRLPSFFAPSRGTPVSGKNFAHETGRAKQRYHP